MFMQISDLFGQYDRNTAVNSQGTGNATGVSGTNPTLAQAMRMLPAGSVFEATVNEMENGEVLLGLSDGRNRRCFIKRRGIHVLSGEIQ